MQRLALFDLDDTLVDRRAAFAAWAAEFVAAHRLPGPALESLLAADAQHTGPMDGFFGTVGRLFDRPEAPDALWAQYRRRMPELASCRPADLDALRRLRRAGWRIGIVTNGMADNQLAKIRGTGLDRLVDAWCISGEVGIRKPDPAIFRLAAARCGADPGQGGWMVGDSLTLDVAGGQAAGLRTIWVRTEQRPAPDRAAESAAAAVEIILGRGPGSTGR